MKKKSGWIWMLGIAIGCAVSAVMAFLDRQYEGDLFWTTPLIGVVVFAFLAYSMRKKAKAEEETFADAARRKLDAMEAARKEQEERAEKVRLFHERYPQERFAVAGVTFKNDDKTDRQQILREIVLNENGSCDVWFEEETEGEHPGIRVLTDCGCVGYVRRSDLEKFRRFISNPVTTVSLEAEHFENDEGEKIYRADIVFVLDRESPQQKWYFDGLS